MRRDNGLQTAYQLEPGGRSACVGLDSYSLDALSAGMNAVGCNMARIPIGLQKERLSS